MEVDSEHSLDVVHGSERGTEERERVNAQGRRYGTGLPTRVEYNSNGHPSLEISAKDKWRRAHSSTPDRLGGKLEQIVLPFQSDSRRVVPKQSL